MIKNIGEIRNASLIDVIGQYTLLKRTGDQWTGLCPFHNERTPSFYVSDGKGYHCFGCGEKGGNPIDFIMGIENKPFADAVEYLANYSGINVHDVHSVQGVNIVNKRERVNKEKADYINPDLIKTNLERYRDNTLFQYFADKYRDEAASEVFQKYGAGSCNTPVGHTTLFIQRDINNQIRQTKAIKYKPDGHRDRSITPMIIGKQISGKNDLRQCFFGEHLIKQDSEPVAIVESEKTAMMASIHYPQFTWIATGGKSGCSMPRPEINKVLHGRIVHLFPDRDGIEDWRKQSVELNKQGIQAFLNDLIGNYRQYGEKADIGDILALMPFRKFPKWYLQHVSILKKKTAGELSSSEYWTEAERIADEAGMTAVDYVKQINHYDPIYFDEK